MNKIIHNFINFSDVVGMVLAMKQSMCLGCLWYQELWFQRFTGSLKMKNTK